MATNAKGRILAAFVVVAILALLYGAWSRHNLTSNAKAQTAVAQLLSGTVFPTPRQINPFQLTGDNKKPFTNANLQNHWTFVFFGFTHCPALCPTTLSTLNQVYKNLQTDHPQQLPQVLFISVDPEQDKPKVIREYLSGFNPAFVGATGSAASIDTLTQEFNVMYAKVFPDGDKNYTIDHSGTIILIDPNGQVYAVFSTPHNANNIAKDYMDIVDHYSKKA